MSVNGADHVILAAIFTPLMTKKYPILTGSSIRRAEPEKQQRREKHYNFNLSITLIIKLYCFFRLK
jgi:hypothetical protein